MNGSPPLCPYCYTYAASPEMNRGKQPGRKRKRKRKGKAPERGDSQIQHAQIQPSTVSSASSSTQLKMSLFCATNSQDEDVPSPKHSSGLHLLIDAANQPVPALPKEALYLTAEAMNQKKTHVWTDPEKHHLLQRLSTKEQLATYNRNKKAYAQTIATSLNEAFGSTTADFVPLTASKIRTQIESLVQKGQACVETSASQEASGSQQSSKEAPASQQSSKEAPASQPSVQLQSQEANFNDYLFGRITELIKFMKTNGESDRTVLMKYSEGLHKKPWALHLVCTLDTFAEKKEFLDNTFSEIE